MMKNEFFFDSDFNSSEQIPRQFTIHFEEVNGDKNQVKVSICGLEQIGDIINDNSYKNDFYRYHDIFHYSFATLLGWSPCTRALMKRKRKSNALVDEVEDGARAIIIEEAISMIIFNEAKRKNYFKNCCEISNTTLTIIKEMTENLEVSDRTPEQWKKAILKAYEMFRLLISNGGGKVEFDAITKDIKYFSSN